MGTMNWISKPSDTSFLPIGRMVQTITNPTLGSINSCVLCSRARDRPPKGERHLPGSYRLVTNDVCRAHFLSAPLSIGTSIWFHSFGGSWWLGKVKQPSNVLGRYVVRFLDNPGPALIDLPKSAYNTALPAPCGSWCLQTHGRINPLQGVLHG